MTDVVVEHEEYSHGTLRRELRFWEAIAISCPRPPRWR